ncbi:Tubulin-folding cofactor E [Vitis vinifera]|uniref:Leucine-rich repeat-containing protein 51 n=1 Tax=Vitis vinifera TaxID=29760 RepID=A0A438DCI8_VITVI|nr:Tubulin-folding cofactor E [Vitis vinifera]
MLNNRFSCLNWSLPLQDVGTICVQLPGLAALNLSNNLMAHDITGLPLLMNLRVLVLNNTGIKWKEVEIIRHSLPAIEELHLMGNNLRAITGCTSFAHHALKEPPQHRNPTTDPGCSLIRLPKMQKADLSHLMQSFRFSISLAKQKLFNSTSLPFFLFFVIQPASSSIVQGFDYLRLLNLEDNHIAEWDEILKLSQLRSLEQLHLNKNHLKHIFYPDSDAIHQLLNGIDSLEKGCKPFQNLHCLLLGGNNIEDLASVDSLNSFPMLKDIRLSENPVADPGRGGIPRFVLIARLSKVEILNGSEVSRRERKESEIRYVRLVISKMHGNPEEITRLHPRFAELKEFHGIEDERPLTGAAGPQKMASGLLSINLKCIGASIGEKPPLTKKLPATTTIGKLKNLCESFFKLKSIKPRLFLQEEGSPLPILLDDEMASLMDLGIGSESTILIDEES